MVVSLRFYYIWVQSTCPIIWLDGEEYQLETREQIVQKEFDTPSCGGKFSEIFSTPRVISELVIE